MTTGNCPSWFIFLNSLDWQTWGGYNRTMALAAILFCFLVLVAYMIERDNE
jgi:hypothetical protein